MRLLLKFRSARLPIQRRCTQNKTPLWSNLNVSWTSTSLRTSKWLWPLRPRAPTEANRTRHKAPIKTNLQANQTFRIAQAHQRSRFPHLSAWKHFWWRNHHSWIWPRRKRRTMPLTLIPICRCAQAAPANTQSLQVAHSLMSRRCENCMWPQTGPFLLNISKLINSAVSYTNQQSKNRLT